MLQQKCELFSEHVVDSVRHRDSGSDSLDTDTRVVCDPTNPDSFLAARVTVPAGDDYIGSDGTLSLRLLLSLWGEYTKDVFVRVWLIKCHCRHRSQCAALCNLMITFVVTSSRCERNVEVASEMGRTDKHLPTTAIN